MTNEQAVEIGVTTMILCAKVAAPILLTALLVGFLISVFQSATQIQEPTLAFVPKAVAVGIALVLCGNWMLTEMITFTQGLFEMLPRLTGRG